MLTIIIKLINHIKRIQRRNAQILKDKRKQLATLDWAIFCAVTPMGWDDATPAHTNTVK